MGLYICTTIMGWGFLLLLLNFNPSPLGVRRISKFQDSLVLIKFWHSQGYPVSKSQNKTFDLYFICVWVLCLHEYTCSTCVQFLWRPEEGLNSLGLELQVVVNCNRVQVWCKSSQCSLPLSQLYLSSHQLVISFKSG